jgi:hypothetical protein
MMEIIQEENGENERELKDGCIVDAAISNPRNVTCRMELPHPSFQPGIMVGR